MNNKSKLSNEVLFYLISFLLREENIGLKNNIIYAVPDAIPKKGSIYIIPSKFFQDGIYLTDGTVPSDDCPCLEGIPVLFGKAKIEMFDDYIIIYADIIASSFYLISRYEECIRVDNKDNHGRSIGRESILAKMGALEYPLIEKYSMLIRKYLRCLGHVVVEPANRISHIYLTHDVDKPWSMPVSLKGKLFCLLRDVVLSIFSNKREYYKADLKALLGFGDHVDTFDYMIKTDDDLVRCCGPICDVVYFLMTCARSPHDMGYIDNVKKTKSLLKKLQAANAKIGLHVSYKAGENRELIVEEQNKFKQFLGETAFFSRHHFLMTRSPKDYEILIKTGVTDDFSMCYADGGGYRLGTCRAVFWINPYTMQVTSLKLHPLLVTEGKLCHKEYMGLSFEEAILWIKCQINAICRENGELTLLFHNTSFSKHADFSYGKIYESIISILKEKCVCVNNSNL